MKKSWFIGMGIVVLIAIFIFTKGFGLFNSTITSVANPSGDKDRKSVV